MIRVDRSFQVQIKANSPIGSAPAISIGEQQARMALASLGFNTRQSDLAAHSFPFRDALPGVHQTRFPRLGSARRGDSGDWSEVDETCPYCKSSGYALHAHPYGNLTRLEGSCGLCGTHSLRLLA
jgi:hypothetical protein